MIIINKNSVKVNNNSIEIPLEEVLNQVYMLMDVNDMDISDYISCLLYTSDAADE